jgi:transposase
VNSRTLQRHYKHQVSGYHEWDQKEHADDYILYPNNIGQNLSIDEVSLSKGELYTIVTNKKSKSQNKGCVVAIINGTKSQQIQNVLGKIPIEQRLNVRSVSMDMANNMAQAAQCSFQNSVKVIDKFHVVRLVMDAVQHLRVKLRWQVMDQENLQIKLAKEKGQKYHPQVLTNGDTLKELLVRSKYLLYKFQHEWTSQQMMRATLLFKEFPILKQIYDLSIEFRRIYNESNKAKAIAKLLVWKNNARMLKIDELNSVIYSLDHHLPNILNYFDDRHTNAYAESFNSKIKGFRANLRGVTDTKFFLFRIAKLYA